MTTVTNEDNLMKNLLCEYCNKPNSDLDFEPIQRKDQPPEYLNRWKNSIIYVCPSCVGDLWNHRELDKGFSNSDFKYQFAKDMTSNYKF
jgi:hypothetical protein